jgi:hypothetical protein
VGAAVVGNILVVRISGAAEFVGDFRAAHRVLVSSHIGARLSGLGFADSFALQSSLLIGHLGRFA